MRVLALALLLSSCASGTSVERVKTAIQHAREAREYARAAVDLADRAESRARALCTEYRGVSPDVDAVCEELR